MRMMNQVYNESCLHTMKRIGDQSIDLVVTSPPYNMRLRVNNDKYIPREKTKHLSKKYDFFEDCLSIDEYYDFHHKVLKQLLRVSKVVFWNFSIVTGSKEAVFKLIGTFSTYIKDIIVWDKGHGEPAIHGGILNRATELILVLESDEKKGRMIRSATFDRGTVDDIWRIKRPKSSDNHKAIMPFELADKAIQYFCPKGGIVYDPFAGTGTTIKAAIKNECKWIASELQKEYVELIKKELDNLSIQLNLKI